MGKDVFTNVISANDNDFASTFLMQIFKFQKCA